MNDSVRLKASDLLGDILQRPIGAVALDGNLSVIAGWDSMMMVRLMLRLEEHLGREMSEAELESIATIADVQRLLNGDNKA